MGFLTAIQVGCKSCRKQTKLINKYTIRRHDTPSLENDFLISSYLLLDIFFEGISCVHPIRWQVELYWNHAPKTCTLDILERQRTRSIMSQKVLRVLRHTQVVYYVVMSCYYSIVRCYCLFYCTQLKYFQDFIRMISVFEVKLRSHD